MINNSTPKKKRIPPCRCTDTHTDERQDVVVKIKNDVKIKGYPSDLLKLQSKIIKNAGSENKWTFSFDNRSFLASLDKKGIDILKKDSDIYDVIEEAKLVVPWWEYGPEPPFTPGAENVDWGVSQINPQAAWAKNIKGQGVKVCVVDSGVDYNHVDLVDRYEGGYNFIGSNNNTMDGYGHGTMCSGIICASENSTGYTGVAPLAKLYACRVLNDLGVGYPATAAAGVDWCVVNGMDIVNLSLGEDTACTGTLATACANAWAAGLTIFAAAGNDGEESVCSGNDCLLCPANCSSTIAVGATDKHNYRSPFSSTGPELELVAPGESVAACRAAGTDMTGGKAYRLIGDHWFWCAGTSSATPHAAGAGVLVKCWFSDATNVQIRDYLNNNAQDL
jgi:subtilisin family serine protease